MKFHPMTGFIRGIKCLKNVSRPIKWLRQLPHAPHIQQGYRRSSTMTCVTVYQYRLSCGDHLFDKSDSSIQDFFRNEFWILHVDEIQSHVIAFADEQVIFSFWCTERSIPEHCPVAVRTIFRRSKPCVSPLLRFRYVCVGAYVEVVYNFMHVLIS